MIISSLAKRKAKKHHYEKKKKMQSLQITLQIANLDCHQLNPNSKHIHTSQTIKKEKTHGTLCGCWRYI